MQELPSSNMNLSQSHPFLLLVLWFSIQRYSGYSVKGLRKGSLIRMASPVVAKSRKVYNPACEEFVASRSPFISVVPFASLADIKKLLPVAFQSSRCLSHAFHVSREAPERPKLLQPPNGGMK